MALEFMDGFDHYTSTASFRMKWDATSSYGNATGRFGGLCLAVDRFTAIVTLTQQATRTVGFAFRTDWATLTGDTICGFQDAGNPQCDLRLDATGAGLFVVTRNGTVLATSSTALSPSTWYYLEFQVTIGSSAPYVVRLNGSNIISGTGNTQNTSNASANQLILGQVSQGKWDDLYMENSATFLGE